MSNFLYKRIFSELGNVLPRDVKRAFFIMSVFFAVKRAEKPSTELVKKINDLLNTVHVKSRQNLITLEISNVLTHYIWKSFDENGIVIDGERFTIDELCGTNIVKEKSRYVGERLISGSPEWLKYGSTELMVNDLFFVFKKLSS